MSAARVGPGDRVLLWEAEPDRRHLVVVDGAGARKQRGLGVFDPARLLDLAWGDAVEIAGKRFLVLRPTPSDVHATIRRKAQIITQKDLGRIVAGLGVRAGDRVFESGIGSGAATAVLAEAVGHDGRVVVQELREDFADWARENLATAGLDDRVEIHLGDLADGLVDGVAGPFDAALLDQPEPWDGVRHLAPALATGARVCCYCPQVSQMETTARALDAAGFRAIECVEVIERVWQVKERGSRPTSDGIGHTAFLVFARWPGA